MAFELREGSFALFENDKRGNDKAPDMKGNGLLNGKEHEIAAWRKQGSKGEFLSILVKLKTERPSAPSSQVPRAAINPNPPRPSAPLKPTASAAPTEEQDVCPF